MRRWEEGTREHSGVCKRQQQQAAAAAGHRPGADGRAGCNRRRTGTNHAAARAQAGRRQQEATTPSEEKVWRATISLWGRLRAEETRRHPPTLYSSMYFSIRMASSRKAVGDSEPARQGQAAARRQRVDRWCRQGPQQAQWTANAGGDHSRPSGSHRAHNWLPRCARSRGDAARQARLGGRQQAPRYATTAWAAPGQQALALLVAERREGEELGVALGGGIAGGVGGGASPELHAQVPARHTR